MMRTLAILSLSLAVLSGCGTLSRVKHTPKTTPGTELARYDLRDAPRAADAVAVSEAGITARGLRLSDVKTVRFALDSSTLDEAARAALRENARILQAHPQVRATISGHADDLGTTEYNIALAHRRAVAVKNYYKHLGLDTARLDPRSYGEERPLCLEASDACRHANRRAATEVETRSLLGR